MIARSDEDIGNFFERHFAGNRIIRIDPIADFDVFNILRNISHENIIFVILYADNNLRTGSETGIASLKPNCQRSVGIIPCHMSKGKR
jgi:3'-phosphoadenosine 5'-phosphosulfate sulfotransferase (PAPS reductase)/FAD synthetase